MYGSQMNYFPISLPFLGVLALALGILIVLVQLQAVRYVYERLGVSAYMALFLLIVSLLGSYINIPLFELPEREVLSNRVVDVFGMRYIVPEVQDWPGTVVAVNVGGAVIPVLLSAYVLVKRNLWFTAALATAIVTLVCHAIATPVPGLGIALPTFVPAIVATIAALVVARRDQAAVGYIGGSMGTLIGADLMNLGRIQGLGAPVASIGGAGTFDGIFVTGILAVLLAGIWSRD